MVHGGEEDNAIAGFRVQPERRLDGLHHVAEDPHALGVGLPAVAARLPLGERFGDLLVRGEVVAEVARLGELPNGITYGLGGQEVHVCHPRGNRVGPVIRPLDAAERPQPIEIGVARGGIDFEGSPYLVGHVCPTSLAMNACDGSTTERQAAACEPSGRGAACAETPTRWTCRTASRSVRGQGCRRCTRRPGLRP